MPSSLLFFFSFFLAEGFSGGTLLISGNSDFDRQYDMTKMYATGFEEERTPLEAWSVVFDRMRAAKMIPPAS